MFVCRLCGSLFLQFSLSFIIPDGKMDLKPCTKDKNIKVQKQRQRQKTKQYKHIPSRTVKLNTQCNRNNL